MLVWMDGKGPGEDSDFYIDWTDRLAGDTIVSSSWNVVGTDPATPETSPQLIIMTDAAHQTSFNGSITRVWLSGGTLGITYIIRNTISTAIGEQPLTEMVELPMRNR